MAFRSFYTVSFPPYEQRDEEQQAQALSDERYHLEGYIRDGRLQAFIAYWDFDAYYYIEHFAVHPDLRGQSVGSTVLSGFMANAPLILLEIDPVTDAVSAQRFRFYERLGFVENPYLHIHPAYDTRFDPHPLTILTAPRAISPEEYQRFYRDLTEIILA